MIVDAGEKFRLVKTVAGNITQTVFPKNTWRLVMSYEIFCDCLCLMHNNLNNLHQEWIVLVIIEYNIHDTCRWLANHFVPVRSPIGFPIEAHRLSGTSACTLWSCQHSDSFICKLGVVRSFSLRESESVIQTSNQ